MLGSIRSWLVTYHNVWLGFTIYTQNLIIKNLYN